MQEGKRRLRLCEPKTRSWPFLPGGRSRGTGQSDVNWVCTVFPKFMSTGNLSMWPYLGIGYLQMQLSRISSCNHPEFRVGPNGNGWRPYERRGHRDSRAYGRMPCEERGRHWSDATTRQGTRNDQELEEAGKDSPREPLEGAGCC